MHKSEGERGGGSCLLGDEALGAVGEGEDKEIQTWEFTGGTESGSSLSCNIACLSWGGEERRWSGRETGVLGVRGTDRQAWEGWFEGGQSLSLSPVPAR